MRRPHPLFESATGLLEVKDVATRKNVRKARRVIRDKQLTEFSRSIRNGGVLAARLINDQLDQGESLDEIFYTGDGYGFSLDVKRQKGSSFAISFGCQAGPTSGDGGNWNVEFDDRGHVVSLQGGLSWIGSLLNCLAGDARVRPAVQKQRGRLVRQGCHGAFADSKMVLRFGGKQTLDGFYGKRDTCRSGRAVAADLGADIN